MDNSYNFTWLKVTILIWGFILFVGTTFGGFIDHDLGIIVSISLGSGIICGMIFLIWQKLNNILGELRKINV